MPATRPVVPLLVVLFIALACVLPATPAHAQATRGQCSAPSPTRARGSAWCDRDSHRGSNGVVHTAVANATGNYSFPNLPDGIYNVKGELQGSTTVIREGVRVAVNTTMRIDRALQVGGLEETVTVTGETPLLQTDRTDTGACSRASKSAAMPLAYNRNFQGMMVTIPGAAKPHREHSEFFNATKPRSEVNGQSRMANNVQIEGIDNNMRTGVIRADPACRSHRPGQRHDQQLRCEFGRRPVRCRRSR